MNQKNLQPTQFHYMNIKEAESIYKIQIDIAGYVEVMGDDGSYEWLIWNDGILTMHSNVGYGQPAIALRDGLNKALPFATRAFT